MFLMMLMEQLLLILMLLVCTNNTHFTFIDYSMAAHLKRDCFFFISLASAYITSSSGVVTADAGSDVTLTVTASGDPDDITYEWKKNEVIIPGERSNSLTLNDISSEDIGQYECIPSNSVGSHNSSVIQVNVNCKFNKLMYVISRLSSFILIYMQSLILK